MHSNINMSPLLVASVFCRLHQMEKPVWRKDKLSHMEVNIDAAKDFTPNVCHILPINIEAVCTDAMVVFIKNVHP